MSYVDHVHLKQGNMGINYITPDIIYKTLHKAGSSQQRDPLILVPRVPRVLFYDVCSANICQVCGVAE